MKDLKLIVLKFLFGMIFLTSLMIHAAVLPKKFDENNDGLDDRYDLNRDGKPDHNPNHYAQKSDLSGVNDLKIKTKFGLGHEFAQHYNSHDNYPNKFLFGNKLDYNSANNLNYLKENDQRLGDIYLEKPLKYQQTFREYEPQIVPQIAGHLIGNANSAHYDGYLNYNIQPQAFKFNGLLSGYGNNYLGSLSHGPVLKSHQPFGSHYFNGLYNNQGGILNKYNEISPAKSAILPFSSYYNQEKQIGFLPIHNHASQYGIKSSFNHHYPENIHGYSAGAYFKEQPLVELEYGNIGEIKSTYY